MPAVHLNHLVRSLRHAVSPHRWDAAGDAELLDRYHADHDAGAFEAIVRRHGGRVLAVCRKVLADSADVEDVFQATFLVLLRQGAGIRRPDSLGSWLCGVAHRLALQARSRSARRARAESAKQPPPLEEPADLSWREACVILHEELDRLPETYRLPLLLCYLEGRTRDEAAELLGCSLGALHGRLERGRERLRQRLIRRGITLSAGLFSALAANSASAGGLSEHLIQAAVAVATSGPASAAVVALAQGAPAPCSLGKSKLLAAVLLAVGVISVSVGLSMSAVTPASTPSACLPEAG
jgi:RNA polymerase sigma factor (sigma-70 family)